MLAPSATVTSRGHTPPVHRRYARNLKYHSSHFDSLPSNDGGLPSLVSKSLSRRPLPPLLRRVLRFSSSLSTFCWLSAVASVAKARKANSKATRWFASTPSASRAKPRAAAVGVVIAAGWSYAPGANAHATMLALFLQLMLKRLSSQRSITLSQMITEWP